MIASIRGEVLVRRPDHVVVEAAGVGYHLAVSSETLGSVPAVGDEIRLHTHLAVRDDAMQLYGFATEAERELFLSLISVSGIGPKVALAILCDGSPGELLRALAAGDAKRFQAARGVGKRTAERIIVELRERVAGQLGEATVAGSELGPGDAAASQDPRLLAREGLLHLGYSLVEAERLLSGCDGETVEDLINQALRQAARG